MDSILAALERAAAAGLIPEGSSLLLAVSGGADSLALLVGCVEASRRTGWRLSVGHVHHGWRGRDADRDLAFVADHARRLELPFLFRRRNAREAAARLRLSPEAAARHVRYAALREMRSEAGAALVATAHQRDDAVESHVLARQRGGGLARLAGPRERREDGVVRPLLAVSRRDILRFLADRSLGFRRDATNGDLGLARNRIRRALAAASEDELAAVAGRVAALAEERERLERDYALRIAPSVGNDGLTTTVDAWLFAGCPDELRRLALSRLAGPYAREGRPPFTGREREQILELLASGRNFRFEAGRRIRFERRRGRLHIGPHRASRRESERAFRGESERAFGGESEHAFGRDESAATVYDAGAGPSA